MKQIALLLLAFSLGASMSKAESYKLKYHTGNLASAKKMAKTENKMVFVKFYADWCVPCKWMDETTLSDRSVVQKINDNFVPIKVNIDDFDGFALRQELGISVLPTMIIYDSNGAMVKRMEETLPASKLNRALDHLMRQNGKRIIHNVNQAPSQTIVQSRPRPTKTIKKKTFKLQLGVFKGFENTMNYLNEIKDKVDGQAMVLHDYRDGHTMYKVLIGRYMSAEEAARARDDLRMLHGIDSVIY